MTTPFEDFIVQCIPDADDPNRVAVLRVYDDLLVARSMLRQFFPDQVGRRIGFAHVLAVANMIREQRTADGRAKAWASN